MDEKKIVEELKQLEPSEIAGMDRVRCIETARDIRRQIVLRRMDIYADKGREVHVKRALKRNLARVLTRLTTLNTETST